EPRGPHSAPAVARQVHRPELPPQSRRKRLTTRPFGTRARGGSLGGGRGAWIPLHTDCAARWPARAAERANAMRQKGDPARVGGQVVTPSGFRRGGIAVHAGRIVAVADEAVLPPSRERLDVRGHYVLPGIVDPECHIGNPRDLQDDFVSETRAAASAGVTTW